MGGSIFGIRVWCVLFSCLSLLSGSLCLCRACLFFFLQEMLFHNKQTFLRGTATDANHSNSHSPDSDVTCLCLLLVLHNNLSHSMQSCEYTFLGCRASKCTAVSMTWNSITWSTFFTFWVLYIRYWFHYRLVGMKLVFSWMQNNQGYFMNCNSSNKSKHNCRNKTSISLQILYSCQKTQTCIYIGVYNLSPYWRGESPVQPSWT